MPVVLIPLQRARDYGPKVLTNDAADAHDFDSEQLLSALNVVFTRTDSHFKSLSSRNRGIRNLFTVYQTLDVGGVYARIRQSRPWGGNINNENHFLSRLAKLEHDGEVLEGSRQSSVDDGVISNPRSIKPRRVWDLRANRVIPYYYSCGREVWAVSHSWTDVWDTTKVNTPINNHEWPVPLPSGISLDTIRTELLNHNAEYAWLDVLCIRQRCPDPGKEAQRKEEWAIDLPTIGSVFLDAKNRVIWYMNGLGRALKSSGWDHPRHWLKRAWTLQEIGGRNVFDQRFTIGGIPEGVINPMDMISVETGRTLQSRVAPIREMRTLLDSGDLFRAFIFTIHEMKVRLSTNPVDKVAGIAMLLQPLTVPVYDESLLVEDAWSLCIRHLSPKIWRYLLTEIGTPGDSGVAWRPSWSQLMTQKLPPTLLFPSPDFLANESINTDSSCAVTAYVVPAQLTSDSSETSPTGLWRFHLRGSETYELNLHSWEGSPVVSTGYYYLASPDFAHHTFGSERLLNWVVCTKEGVGYENYL